MHKRARVVVPIFQTALVLGSFLWAKLSVSNTQIHLSYPAKDIVIKLNYPLLVFWEPVFALIERLFSNGPASRSADLLVALALALAILCSVAVFWYFVIVDAEMRRKGRSLIRFRNRLAEAIKLLAFALLAAGAFAYAYFSARGLLYFYLSGRGLKLLYRVYLFGGGLGLLNYAYVTTADEFLGGFFLIAWGALLLATFWRDLLIFVRMERDAGGQ